MKPRIYFERNVTRCDRGQWKLTYGFFPRQFDLFGCNDAERKYIAQTCVMTQSVDTLSDAYDLLKQLYCSLSIRREEDYVKRTRTV